MKVWPDVGDREERMATHPCTIRGKSADAHRSTLVVVPSMTPLFFELGGLCPFSAGI